MSVPIQELIDTTVTIFGFLIGAVLYPINQYLTIIPALGVLYWFIFEPRIGDGVTGFYVMSSRWETWKTGKPKFWRLK